MSKPFKDTTVGKVLRGAGAVLAPKLMGLLEGATSVKDAISIIKGSDEPPEVKLQLEQIALQHEAELTKRLESDNKQELWLPKMVRPLTLLVLVVAYISGFFFKYDVSVFHAPLMTVFGFYFGGRSVEKLLGKHV